ncbi:hypothetical protein [Pelagibacterium sp.]|uniref:hypothetical protein n=1 Tax=Pelagibacterium sp. TaxID=1967288 RepID=UPI003A931745
MTNPLANEFDDRAHHIALSLETLIGELKRVAGTERAVALAEKAKHDTEQLCDDLEPVHGDWLEAAQLAVSYGTNVVPFAPR